MKGHSSREILHHGLCSEEFEVEYCGTDYFTFWHKPCFKERKDDHHGHCAVTAILIDHQGRVIFNLKCISCGEHDALKTTAYLWEERNKDPLKVFHLSPKLRKRCKRHSWDNF